MVRHRFSLLLPAGLAVITAGLWLSARAQYQTYLCAPAGVCPPNSQMIWTDYTPPSLQTAGMLNLPVAIFAQPLYQLVQGTVSKSELAALLIGVVVLWTYIGWRIDTRRLAPCPKSTFRVLATIAGCAFGAFLLTETVNMFHVGLLFKFVGVCWSVLICRHFLLVLCTSPVTEGTVLGPRLPRINLVSIAISWAVFLVIAALALPPLDSHGTPNATLAHVFAVCAGCLLLATSYGVLMYLITAWRKSATVPNRSSYVVWLGFETSLAVIAVAAMLYIVMRR